MIIIEQTKYNNRLTPKKFDRTIRDACPRAKCECEFPVPNG